MSEVSERILRMFSENKIEHEIYEHAPVRTSEDAARIRGVPLRTGVKALVFRGKDDFILVLVPADEKADVKTLAKKEDVKKISMATSQDVLQETGCVVGSVPPFGHNRKFRTYFSRGILKNEYVNFNIGELTLSAKIRSADLLKLVRNPVMID